jgi:hypothetical protein
VPIHGPDRRGGKSGRRHDPKSLTGLAGHKGAIALASAARTPPGLEVGGAGELLDVIGTRPSPVLLQQEIGGQPGTDDERGDEEDHHRGRDQHLGAGEDDLAQLREQCGEQQQEGNPVGELPHEIPFIGHGDGEFRFVAVKEEPRDFQVDQRIDGKHQTENKSKCDRCEQPAPRHDNPPCDTGRR